MFALKRSGAQRIFIGFNKKSFFFIKKKLLKKLNMRKINVWSHAIQYT